MIVEYHCPKTLSDAVKLLSRDGVVTVPLGGGTILNRPSPEPLAVVDLQSLGLNTARRRGHGLQLGATLTLQSLLDLSDMPPALAEAIRGELTYNLRQVATVAGVLVAANGRSPFAAAMLALDAMLTLLPGEEQIGLGDLLPLRAEKLHGRLITQATIPLNARLAYEYVARTPADLPIVCMAIAQWPAGRTRLALGGFGATPVLAMDGPQEEGAEIAAGNAYSQADDEWASAEYRADVAAVLARRCLTRLKDES